MTEEKKYIFIYLTTNLLTKKQYIGDHRCDNLEKDNYLGSGKILLKAIKKYKRENFKREILEFFSTKKEAFESQGTYIDEYNTLIPNGYNISPKGGLGVRGCHSEKTKQTLSELRKGKPGIKGPRPDLTGEKNGMAGKSVYDRWVELYGVEEATKLMKKYVKHHNISMKGNTWELSDETKIHRKEALLQTIGVDNVAKLQQVRQKISNTLKGNIPWNKGLKKEDIKKRKLMKQKVII